MADRLHEQVRERLAMRPCPTCCVEHTDTAVHWTSNARSNVLENMLWKTVTLLVGLETHEANSFIATQRSRRLRSTPLEFPQQCSHLIGFGMVASSHRRSSCCRHVLPDAEVKVWCEVVWCNSGNSQLFFEVFDDVLSHLILLQPSSVMCLRQMSSDLTPFEHS